MLVPLLDVVLVLLLVGVGLWLINRYVPLASGIRNLLNGVVILGVVLWLFRVLGIGIPISRPILNVIVTLIVLGVLLWVVNTYIPMASVFRGILNIVVIAMVCLWLLQVFGVAHTGLGRQVTTIPAGR